MIESIRWEYEGKFIIIILAITIGVLIGIPILAYELKFEVDERPVIFSVNGVPYCPYCYRIVEPHVGYCRQCQRRHRWVDAEVKCWYCFGRKLCDVCEGSGNVTYMHGELPLACYGCHSVEYIPQPPTASGEPRPPKARWSSEGYCPHCNERGYVIWGASNFRIEPERH